MRLGILSDAHGNVEAFQLALGILAQAGAELIYFLGDSVGYIPDKRVVSLLEGSNIRALKGNHDDMLVQQRATAEEDAVYRHRETFAALTNVERDFLMALPSQLEVREQGADFLFVHGSPADPLTGYVYPDSSLSDFSGVTADVVFMGHTHRPFVRRHDGKLFVNVGSCGLPRGDDLRGSACIFDVKDCDAKILRFDISRSCKCVLSRYSLSPSVTSLLSRCATYRVGNDLEG
ncbi:metallophosphoesterase [Bradyrhizobium jicamae]|uniref:metallophosphoesterase family protein n=1 Tax=Bradyrhizobium jicamae TaxID=280332 RepID=UPI001BAA555E|nr:metallophosphoesterase family protein [Bradyrhizobium jicamae]MBR0938031.1 metallophosphoesterase family protein [Bradyrhizobium jicamae]